jgi:hypothetical protein
VGDRGAREEEEDDHGCGGGDGLDDARARGHHRCRLCCVDCDPLWEIEEIRCCLRLFEKRADGRANPLFR